MRPDGCQLRLTPSTLVDTEQGPEYPALMMRTSRARLLQLLTEKSYEEREVVLSSGKTSNFYVDCKQTTLDAEGHVLVGRLLLAEIDKYERRSGKTITGVGGLTLGADPIASAVSLTSALAARPIPAFIVRKEPKGHGTGAYLEGMRNLPDGGEVVVVEDVATTGASALAAVERVRAAGYVCNVILTLVDRQEGAMDAVQAAGVEMVALFERDDFTTPSDT